MTEQEWLTSTDTAAMLAWVHGGQPRHRPPRAPQPPITDRKLRLFACACCRQVWYLLTDPRSRAAVEVTERFADNPTSEMAMETRRAVHGADDGLGHCVRSLHREAPVAADNAAFYARQVEGQAVIQAALLRCIVGNPFRPPQQCSTKSALQFYDALEWNDGAVVKLAQAVSDDRAWDRLPILADALEEAGCTDDDILFHLRGLIGCHHCDGAGIYYDPPHSLNRLKCPHCNDGLLSPPPHARGCWVLDLLLGKE